LSRTSAYTIEGGCGGLVFLPLQELFPDPGEYLKLLWCNELSELIIRAVELSAISPQFRLDFFEKKPTIQ
jgi:hypothetical protein